MHLSVAGTSSVRQAACNYKLNINHGQIAMLSYVGFALAYHCRELSMENSNQQKECELAIGCGSHAYLQEKQALSSHTKIPQKFSP
ncbi:uncharacterized protein Bfra_008333 [Botrytis fragariae]|uniref:Uncharacterized protein n=1 Tax=Botrytis fragariae TaxID=1964551 RepID=A0A8H6ASL6_9HELO|nr:uncharacterized protein Bfra_008333 [Botrytis fragariae]KAF5873056.1 hypothetical protein Bfra_008333 [Botrytis fragariae]